MIGKRRKKILLYLDKPKMSKQIAKDCKMSLSHVSNSVTALHKRILLICLTPKEKVGRIYGLTKEGKKVRDYILKEE